jgi:uncharacterized protein YbjT (DUF2867 family)
MKVAIAGAFGHLGYDILKGAINKNYEVVALDLNEKDVEEKGKYVFHKIDVTNPDSLTGTLDGVDVLITTVGLVSKSAKLTNYDIDYQGNLNLLEEAKKANVKRFIYVSVIHAETAPDVPMLDAKYKFEEKLKASGLSYSIVRPTGYFYDIAHVFMPMIEKGKVTLLGRKDYPVNVIDTSDLGAFILERVEENENSFFEIGGKEIYTYKQIAEMFFEAAGKKVKISRAPVFLFDLIIKKASKKNDGSEAIIRFSKWTLTHAMEGSTKYGEKSFKEYIKSLYVKKEA